MVYEFLEEQEPTPQVAFQWAHVVTTGRNRWPSVKRTPWKVMRTMHWGLTLSQAVNLNMVQCCLSDTLSTSLGRSNSFWFVIGHLKWGWASLSFRSDICPENCSKENGKNKKLPNINLQETYFHFIGKRTRTIIFHHLTVFHWGLSVNSPV